MNASFASTLVSAGALVALARPVALALVLEGVALHIGLLDSTLALVAREKTESRVA
ncbi:MAG TPA: hypothetical protein VG710_18770 [Opitutus sp.]|nr:hypothetical protein [Opitutus sp.]